MSQLVAKLCLTLLLLCPMLPGTVGCRMCDTPYDYCISAHIDRPNDFRGCGPLYRAGSILSGDGNGVCQTAYYEESNLFNNAGSYGVTTLVSASQTPQTLPRENQGGREWISDPHDSPDTSVPSVEDLIIRRRRETSPERAPIQPPTRPKIAPMPQDDGSTIESIPFSPNDELAPPPRVPPNRTDDLPITLEELQRLDPSVRDIQIISIEDAADISLR